MKIWIKLLSFALIAVLLLIVWRSDLVTGVLSGDPEAGRGVSENSKYLFLGLMLLLMVIQNLFTVIPFILLITMNVSILGFTGGYLWSWATSIVAGMVSFWAARYWLQDFFARWLKPALRDRIEDNAFWVVFIGRVFPFIPTSMVNVAAGLSSVGMRPFLYATVLGNKIYIFVLALVPLGIMSVRFEPHTYVIMLMLAGVATVGWRLWRRRRKQKTAGEISTTPATDEPAPR
ncbi:MAG: hypothetical protein K0Q90_2398 [Paenibacillaceae bacterium]|nr:hypothetical protein [Paenibacillaceae bacterium]